MKLTPVYETVPLAYEGLPMVGEGYVPSFGVEASGYRCLKQGHAWRRGGTNPPPKKKTGVLFMGSLVRAPRGGLIFGGGRPYFFDFS